MSQPSSKKPNILFLFSDQQRADSVHCYGQPLAMTPNLDRLASEGVRFADCHTMQPVCGPARACLQTGQYATRNGTTHNSVPLAQDRPLLAPTVREQGYEMGYIGKWHLASRNRHGSGPDVRNYEQRAVPFDLRGGWADFWLAADVLEFTSHGYDGHMWDANGLRRDFPEGRYRVDAQTDWLLEYLDTRDGDKPWCAMISWLEPHHQNDRNCYEGPHGSKERFSNAPVPTDLAEQDGNWDREYADYLGCVASLDENVGRIRAKLEELGQLDNTLIVYTSDHGCHFKTRNREYKRSCHRASTHVPFIVRGPGFTGGQVIEEPISLIDLPPTIVHAAGAVVPETFDGTPLQQRMTAGDWEEEVFVQISEAEDARAVRTRRWVYGISRPWGSDDDTPFAEAYLYDNESDPHELDNRIDDPALAEIRGELRERLLARMEAIGEPVPQLA